jgi:hypothetical protein
VSAPARCGCTSRHCTEASARSSHRQRLHDASSNLAARPNRAPRSRTTRTARRQRPSWHLRRATRRNVGTWAYPQPSRLPRGARLGHGKRIVTVLVRNRGPSGEHGVSFQHLPPRPGHLCSQVPPYPPKGWPADSDPRRALPNPFTRSVTAMPRDFARARGDDLEPGRASGSSSGFLGTARGRRCGYWWTTVTASASTTV